MPTAPARSAVLGAVPAGRESPFHAQTGLPVGRRARPTNDLLALSHRPAGVIAVTAVNALLSRISTATRLDAGDYLRGLCDAWLRPSPDRADPGSAARRPPPACRSAR